MTNRYVLRLILFCFDVAALESLFFGVYWLRFQSGWFFNPVGFSSAELVGPSIVVLCYWLLLLSGFGLYRYDPLRPRSLLINDAFKAASVGVLILFIVTFNPQQPLPATRVILVSYGIGVLLVVAGTRVTLSTILRHLRYRGIGVFRVLLVGNGTRAQQAREFVQLHPELGFKILGAVGGRARGAGATEVLGNYSELRTVIAQQRINTVVFATDTDETHELFHLVRLTRDRRVRSFIPADVYPALVGEVRPALLHGYPLVEVRPELLSWVERAFKRLFDLTASLILLVVSLPVWGVLAIVIALDSAGPLFYVQRRVGRGGRVFHLLKFRSMVQGAEAQTGAVFAERNDPRVTRVGRFMRATRLDELPQFLNVLLGHMSLVGPRPEREEFVQKFVRDIPLYERRLNIKPGITGWSQVHLRYDTGVDSIAQKLKYDFYYIENMSLPLDLKIMLMTLFVMARGEGQ